MRLVREPAKIRSRYLKGWFTLDFLTSIPWDLLIESFLSTEGRMLLKFPKLLKSLKLIRLAKLARLLKIGAFLDWIDDHVTLNRHVVIIVKLFGGTAYFGEIIYTQLLEITAAII